MHCTLKELIDKENIGPKEVTGLEIDTSEGVQSSCKIAGLSNVERLGIIDKSGTVDLDLLVPENVKISVQEIGFVNKDMRSPRSDFSFLEEYPQLTRLRLAGCGPKTDFSVLDSEDLMSRVEELVLHENRDLKDVSFLKHCRKLRKLDLSLCQHIDDFPLSNRLGRIPGSLSVFNSENLKSSIEELIFHGLGHHVKHVNYLGDYRHLKHLDLSGCFSIQDFSFLESAHLKQNLRVFDLFVDFDPDEDFESHFVYELNDISLLSGYKSLEKLKLSYCKKVEDWSPLSSPSLAGTMKELNLYQCHSFKDVSLLKNYQRLERLNLESTSVDDISGIAEHEYVKRGILKHLWLPRSIKWEMIKNGKYANTEAVIKLRKRGVEVHFEDFGPDYLGGPKKPDKEDAIRSLLTRAGFEDESLVSKVKEYDADTEMKGGFSSGIVVSSNGSVVKVARKDICQNENRIYGLKMDKMRSFMPQLKEYLELDNTGVMVLSNVESEPHAMKKSGIRDILIHNLYVMGLFHKEATRAFKEQKDRGIITMPGLIYQTLQGEPHYKSLRMPLEEFTKKELRRFYADMPSMKFVHNLGMIIEDAAAYLREEGDCVVHGDWKLGNTQNGYIFDFGVSHLGKETEDISYFLLQVDLQLDQNARNHYLQEYIRLRSCHDPEFAENTRKHEEMKKHFGPVRLLELSVLAGVRRKRLQTSENERIRLYYLNEF